MVVPFSVRDRHNQKQNQYKSVVYACYILIIKMDRSQPWFQTESFDPAIQWGNQGQNRQRSVSWQNINQYENAILQRTETFKAKNLLAGNQRGFPIQSNQETQDSRGVRKTNGRNITKYIVKMFFKLITPFRQRFSDAHWTEIMKVKYRAGDNGNTNHLQELFGEGDTSEQANRNQRNREIAQEVFSTSITRQILVNNSIKDKENYIATCMCYVYRLNDPLTAGSGVARMRSNNRRRRG